MYKDVIISVMTALLVIECVPYFAECSVHMRTAVFIGIFIPLLFFCFFCDNCVEKWQNYVKSERNLIEYIKGLK